MLAAASPKPATWLSKLPTREEQIDIMAKPDNEYDMLIIGGGATGKFHQPWVLFLKINLL
jgi:hypothetical protein